MSSIVNTSAALAAAVTIGTFALAPAALAQANCTMYAKHAVQQQKTNIERKCNFSGPSWNDQFMRHLTWCKTVGPNKWRAELKTRANMLQKQCGKR